MLKRLYLRKLDAKTWDQVWDYRRILSGENSNRTSLPETNDLCLQVTTKIVQDSYNPRISLAMTLTLVTCL
jgi:hypothetical protein